MTCWRKFNSLPGGLLSFDVDLTTNVDTGPTPDQFAFALADVANSFFDVFAIVDIDSPSPSIQTFSIFGNGVTLTPTVQSLQTVPEPATGLLLLTGLLALMGYGLLYGEAQRFGLVANISLLTDPFRSKGKIVNDYSSPRY